MCVTKKLANNPKDKTKTPTLRSRPDHARSTCVREANCEHGGRRTPSAQNLVTVKDRGGDYKEGVAASKFLH